MSIHGLRLNPQGVRAVMRQPGVREMLMARMERVATQADANAPVGETGQLSTSHYAYMDDRPEVHLPAARVTTDKEYALTVEARTGYLSSALDAANGGEITESKRLVQYTTKSGKTRMATQAQVDNWTRGSR